MVETRLIMNVFRNFALSALILGLSAWSVSAQDFHFTWKRVLMDESRTGTRLSSRDDVKDALGTVKGDVYYAPNGKVFKGGSVSKVARLVLDAQPAMADVKVVVGHSTMEMRSYPPESALSDWFVDELMRATAEKTGKHVDVGIANFGGVRVDMPKGDVLADDIMSMFPFKNNVCYVELRGADLRRIFEQMAATDFQIVGGVRCIAKDRKLVSALVDGKPLDDSKVYGVATISFLLDGGDGFSVAKNAVSVDILPEYIIDVMMPYVKKLTAEGKPIEYEVDGRVQILK